LYIAKASAGEVRSQSYLALNLNYIEKIEFEENTNSQVFPDFNLDKHNKKLDLLEVKTFDLYIIS
jgi:hypothetical protein